MADELESPIVTVADSAAPLFAAALSVTLPLPVVGDPPVTVSQPGALLVAFHVHQLPVVTAIVTVPPFAETGCEAGEIA